MKFIKTDNPDIIKDLINKNYNLLFIESGNIHVFENDPPYESQYSNNGDVCYTDQLNF